MRGVGGETLAHLRSRILINLVVIFLATEMDYGQYANYICSIC